MSKKNNRTALRIYYDILDKIANTTDCRKNDITIIAFLSYSELTKRINFLIDKGLIIKELDQRKTHRSKAPFYFYKLSQEGMNFYRKLTEFSEFLGKYQMSF
jgi:predicted transcriptional regulator